MTKPRPTLAELPDWPGDMDRDIAAAYCSVSVATFEHNCPVRPIRLGRRLLWRREDLDAWRRSLPTVDPPRYKGTDAGPVDTEPPPTKPRARGDGPTTLKGWLDELDAEHAA